MQNYQRRSVNAVALEQKNLDGRIGYRACRCNVIAERVVVWRIGVKTAGRTLVTLASGIDVPGLMLMVTDV